MRAPGPGWRRRALVVAAAIVATAFVGASIVVATIAGHRPRGAPSTTIVAAGPEQGGGTAEVPRAGWVRRRLVGSPPALAALHRQGARLVTGDLRARLRRLRGYPVVLNAWASWCAPCRDELPLMARAAARFGRRVAFVGADVDDSPSSARALLAGDPLSYPSYQATAGELRSMTPIVGFPTTIFFDRRGRLVRSHQGQYADEGLLAADVRRYALGD